MSCLLHNHSDKPVLEFITIRYQLEAIFWSFLCKNVNYFTDLCPKYDVYEKCLHPCVCKIKQYKVVTNIT